MNSNLLARQVVHFTVVLFACLSFGLRGAPVTYAVHVSLDGMGAKYLQFYVTNAPAQFPNFNRLIAQGASTFNARCDYDFSETVPNHISMFTARPVSQPAGQTNTLHHGYSNNFPAGSDTIHANGNPAVPYKSSFFDVAHDYGRSTAFYASKTRLQICDRSYDAVYGALDLIGADNGRDKIDFSSFVETPTPTLDVSNLVTIVLTNLTSAAPRNYSFIHLSEPDLTGHSSGWGSANYSNSVRIVDVQLGRILDTLITNPVLANATAFIVSADHGGSGSSHTTATLLTNYTIPFFIWNPPNFSAGDAYALFANRENPGTNRPSYNAVPQPIRNLDGGNIALSLLDLPPIPGSFAVPIFDVRMRIAQATNGTRTIWWPATPSAFVLECTPTLDGVVQWQAISNGIVNNGGVMVYSVTNLGNQFYRLRKL